MYMEKYLSVSREISLHCCAWMILKFKKREEMHTLWLCVAVNRVGLSFFRMRRLTQPPQQRVPSWGISKCYQTSKSINSSSSTKIRTKGTKENQHKRTTRASLTRRCGSGTVAEPPWICARVCWGLGIFALGKLLRF